MSVKEHPNEWTDIPKETVLEWLDSPCTRLLRKLIDNGIVDYEREAALLMTSPYLTPGETLALSQAKFSAATMSLRQVANILESAEDHVKA